MRTIAKNARIGAVMTIDEAIDRLSGIGVNSYNRMERCLDLIGRMSGVDAYRVLGEAWSSCDNIAAHRETLADWLSRATRAELNAMMHAEDVVILANMPERFTVWRGCYHFNANGLCWSLDPELAKRFTALHRYHKRGEQRLLIEAQVERERASLITDREEQEIVAVDPQVVRVIQLP